MIFPFKYFAYFLVLVVLLKTASSLRRSSEYDFIVVSMGGTGCTSLLVELTRKSQINETTFVKPVTNRLANDDRLKHSFPDIFVRHSIRVKYGVIYVTGNLTLAIKSLTRRHFLAQQINLLRGPGREWMRAQTYCPASIEDGGIEACSGTATKFSSHHDVPSSSSLMSGGTSNTDAKSSRPARQIETSTTTSSGIATQSWEQRFKAVPLFRKTPKQEKEDDEKALALNSTVHPPVLRLRRLFARAGISSADPVGLVQHFEQWHRAASSGSLPFPVIFLDMASLTSQDSLGVQALIRFINATDQLDPLRKLKYQPNNRKASNLLAVRRGRL